MALAGSDPAAHWEDAGPVPGPDGHPVAGRWLRLGDGRAAAELAIVCGLPLMATPDPLGAGTQGLGAVLRAIARHGRSEGSVPETLVGLGGSASTDGGAGLLTGLGARLLDARGRPLPPGGAALAQLARLDLSELVRPGPLVALSDVTAPLLGPSGAAAIFGPQKGAGPAEMTLLEAGLTRFAELVGIDPQQPGLGAAGGTAYALAALGARIEPGAPFLAQATGLTAAAQEAEVLLTGEGRFDATSSQGKVVGHALGLAGPMHRVVIAGQLAAIPTAALAYSLSEIAGSPERARADPARWISAAATQAARKLTVVLG